MSETVKRKFRVDGFVDDLVWLELEEGSKRGLQFAVPAKSPEYDSELKSEIERLNKNDRVDATLVSENDRNTAWRFVSVESDETTRDQVPAND